MSEEEQSKTEKVAKGAKGIVEEMAGKVFGREDLVEEGQDLQEEADIVPDYQWQPGHNDDRGGGVVGGERTGREF